MCRTKHLTPIYNTHTHPPLVTVGRQWKPPATQTLELGRGGEVIPVRSF